MRRRNHLGMVIVSGIILIHAPSPAASAQIEGLESRLKKPFDLAPGYKLGDRDYYRMKTVYLDFGDAGEVTRTSILDGLFSREVVKFEDGRRTDRFIWKSVKKGTCQGRGDPTDLVLMPFAKDFDYSFAAGTWTPDHFPVDLGRIPKTMDGWLFFIKLLDAHTFDVLHNVYAPSKPAVQVGSTVDVPAEGLPVAMDFPPLFTDSTFTNGPVRLTFQGITLFEAESCAIIAFRSDDSRLRMTANVNNMKLATEGVSYYWGQAYISLQARKVVWARLLERVDMTTPLGGGRNIKARTDREITLLKIGRSEFEKKEEPEA